MNGLGDIEIAPTLDPVTLGVMAMAALVIVYYASQDSKRNRSEPKAKKAVKGKHTATADEREVIAGLVSQGASRNEAATAVRTAYTAGARGFNDLFKEAIRELR